MDDYAQEQEYWESAEGQEWRDIYGQQDADDAQERERLELEKEQGYESCEA